MADNTSRKMARIAYDALIDKKAEDVRVIDIENVSSIADFFLIASGTNRTQVVTLADNVDEMLGRAGYEKKQVEGYQSGNWVLLDYGDIIVLHGDGEKTNNDDFIKRVIGKPGDILDIIDGHVIRNGEELTEEYAYFDPNGILNGNNQHFELRDGEYFVMGDNRLHSSDSRYFGPIKRSEMKCKMLFFLWGKKR